MSYIRNGSNPEGLYVFLNMDEEVEFHMKSELVFKVPAVLMDEFVLSYFERFKPDEHEVINSFGSLRVCDVVVDHCNIIIPEEYDTAEIIRLFNANKKTYFKTCLYFNDIELVMWDVTFAYIMNNMHRSILKDRETIEDKSKYCEPSYPFVVRKAMDSVIEDKDDFDVILDYIEGDIKFDENKISYSLNNMSNKDINFYKKTYFASDNFKGHFILLDKCVDRVSKIVMFNSLFIEFDENYSIVGYTETDFSGSRKVTTTSINNLLNLLKKCL